MHKVFVYGTLKRGEPNHGWMQKSEKGVWNFLFEATTAEKYPLIIASRYNIPFLLDVPGRGHHVHGEVYEVDDAMLKHLDILEDHPNFYIREHRDMQPVDEDSAPVSCWVYLLKAFRPELLEEMFIEDYRSRGDHGKPYAERYQRDPTYHARNDVLL